MERITVEREIAGKTIKLETGKIAKQTSGAVWVQSGDSVVLCNVVDGSPREGIDFFPLYCEYQEKMYSAGKIPGAFGKREGRPSSRETLVSRMIDRPIRPNFPGGYMNDVHISCQVLSFDPDVDPSVLAMIGASAALGISHIPFEAVLGAVRIGLIDDQLVANPTPTEMEKSDLDLLVSGSKDSIMMVESSANEITEAKAMEALTMAQQVIGEIVSLEEELMAKVGNTKEVFEVCEESTQMLEKLKADVDGLTEAFRVADKKERGAKVKEFKNALSEKVLSGLSEEELANAKNDFDKAFDELKTIAMREIIFSGTRCDGRALDEVRPIDIETGILPRVHGSTLFTRGETQAIVTTTLGPQKDALLIDDLNEKRFDTFMLHYNFPNYSVGETGPSRGVGRREVGHGTLAQKALTSVLPDENDFPYTVRIVSDITESNGSSSMASVCGGSLSMMDAGVPISAPVAGIAMGLCKDGDREAILTDILGDEDHYGDMDFKVTGTEKGLTALQMDIKIKGLSSSTMEKALEQARLGRLHILGEMNKVIQKPNAEVSKYAPGIKSIKIDPEFIGKVIGPGGAMIRELQKESSAEINIDESGVVSIYAVDGFAIEKATKMIMDLTSVPEVGKPYDGVVKSVKDFGAFIEFMPGTQGLLHISEISDEYVKDINTVIALDDKVKVVISSIDKQGRVKLVREEKYKQQQEETKE